MYTVTPYSTHIDLLTMESMIVTCSTTFDQVSTLAYSKVHSTNPNMNVKTQQILGHAVPEGDATFRGQVDPSVIWKAESWEQV